MESEREGFLRCLLLVAVCCGRVVCGGGGRGRGGEAWQRYGRKVRGREKEREERACRVREEERKGGGGVEQALKGTEGRGRGIGEEKKGRTGFAGYRRSKKGKEMNEKEADR